MPPTIDDIDTSIQDAIAHHESCAAALRRALQEIHTPTPRPGVVSPSITHLAPGEPVIYARVKHPRKAKPGPKPAKLPRGKRKKRTKITAEMVDDMRALRRSGIPQREIADQLGISIGTVANRLRKG